MHRRIIAGIIAASIALTTFGAIPARAGEKDVARIATLLGIAVVGKLIYDKHKEEKERAAQQREVSRSQTYAPVYIPQPQARPQPQPQVRDEAPARTAKPRPEAYQRPAPAYPLPPRPLPQQVDRKILPKECFRSYDTVSGSHLMFGEECLRDTYRFADRLPRECAQRVQTYSGIRDGYDARCLRQSGYSLARG